jgi:hypothetical protein
MSVGPIQYDEIMELKIGDKLRITTDESVIGRKGIISVKNFHSFPEKLLDECSLVFFWHGQHLCKHNSGWEGFYRMRSVEWG